MEREGPVRTSAALTAPGLLTVRVPNPRECESTGNSSRASGHASSFDYVKRTRLESAPGRVPGVAHTYTSHSLAAGSCSTKRSWRSTSCVCHRCRPLTQRIWRNVSIHSAVPSRLCTNLGLLASSNCLSHVRYLEYRLAEGVESGCCIRQCRTGTRSQSFGSGSVGHLTTLDCRLAKFEAEWWQPPPTRRGDGR